MAEVQTTAVIRLNDLLIQADYDPLDLTLAQRFETYLSLILRWNAHINLTAIRDEEGILSRHFVESIVCARALPAGIATLLDFGSGAGIPGIPITLCRPEIAVTLTESKIKKAAFLQEAIRILGITAKVHLNRAEMLSARYDCVTLRAVDRMPQAVVAAIRLVAPRGWLALMTSRAEIDRLQAAAGSSFSWPMVVPLPGSTDRLLALGERQQATS